MSKKIAINGETALSEAIGLLRKTFKEKKYFQIQLFFGKKRSIDQNFTLYGWYKKISDELGEYTPDHVRNTCKYHFGLPILRAENGPFNRMCVALVDPVSYEERINAMNFIQVTSIMTTIQLNKMMEAMQAHWAGRVTLEYDE